MGVANSMFAEVVCFVIPRSPRRPRNLSLIETREKRESSARTVPRSDKGFSFSAAYSTDPAWSEAAEKQQNNDDQKSET
jgi:hypothetical protein